MYKHLIVYLLTKWITRFVLNFGNCWEEPNFYFSGRRFSCDRCLDRPLRVWITCAQLNPWHLVNIENGYIINAIFGHALVISCAVFQFMSIFIIVIVMNINSFISILFSQSSDCYIYILPQCCFLLQHSFKFCWLRINVLERYFPLHKWYWRL